MAREPLVRQRAKHTRSRLGCGVCRIRRVRCDQTKPACNKCTSTGRKCDGYPRAEPSTDNSKARDYSLKTLTPLRPCPSLIQHAGDQGSNLIFFVRHTSVELAGPLKDALWSQLVLQVSHREECVHHLVVALSSLHQSQIAAGWTNLNDQAVRHYTRGLGALNHHILSKDGAGLEITLLCTVMCVTFEWLRGNQTAAIIHLRAGMKLLEQWRLAGRKGSTSLRTSFWSPSGHLIRSTLSPAYRRLYLQAQSVLKNHGVPYPLPDEVNDRDADRPFESFSEARDGLYEIMCQVWSFEKTWEKSPAFQRRKGVSQSPKSRGSPEKAFMIWNARLVKFFEEKPERREDKGAIVIQIWILVIKSMVALKGSLDETECDKFTPTFGEIVGLAEKLHDQHLSTFSADISIVAALYFVGIKCRHPLIRRRAVALLEGPRRREGIWDSAGAANMIRGLLSIEESKAGGEVWTDTDVTRDARLHEFDVVVDEGSQTWMVREKEMSRPVDLDDIYCKLHTEHLIHHK